jgi:hypothetical protein
MGKQILFISNFEGMKQFLMKVLIFTLLLFFVLFIFKKTVPFYWGHKLLDQKMTYVLSEGHFDSFFVGSSRTHRQIIPDVYDQITNRNSFNLGCGGMFGLESEYVLEKLIETYPDVQYVDYFVQDLRPSPIAQTNLHSVQSKYFMDFPRLLRGVNHFADKDNYAQVYRYVLSYTENMLCIGELIPMLKYHLEEKVDLLELMKKQKGYYGLDQELMRENRLDLKQRNSGSRKKRIGRRLKLSVIDKSRFGRKVRDKNINIYMISGSLATHDSLYFDRGHLNTAGARFYTREIAEAKIEWEN